MDANFIIDMIQGVGFPIVMCGALFWKMNKQDEAHKEEVMSLKESFDNNTNVLTKLYEHLTGGDVNEES